ncbi:MAG: hypothetical protein ACSHYA_09735 [Opitutaceae bacterium]
MAKKPQKLIPLTMTEIILRGDAETIRQALEARTQIDTLLEEREAAYQRIAELETQVCDIVGEDGIFPFPAPPMPVADYATSVAPKKKATPAAVAPTEPKAEETPTATVDEAPEVDASSDDEGEEEAPKTDDA